jgi:hypothetical protein
MSQEVHYHRGQPFDRDSAGRAIGAASPDSGKDTPLVGEMTHPVSPHPDSEHNHTPEEERAIREAALDETIAGTFPASDPPSSIPNPDEHDAVVNEEESGSGAP